MFGGLKEKIQIHESSLSFVLILLGLRISKGYNIEVGFSYQRSLQIFFLGEGEHIIWGHVKTRSEMRRNYIHNCSHICN